MNLGDTRVDVTGASHTIFPILTEGPRRITELLLTGVRAQDDSEVAP